MTEAEKLLAECLNALRPFAEFADPRRVVPPGMPITQGSSMARRQLTMGDCYFARDTWDRWSKS